MELASVHPIDTLLVHELETILNREKDLHLQYSSIDQAASTPEARNAFSKELSALKDRADRLYRLINAMEYYGPFASHTDGLNSTAAA
jgi:spore coat protein CotF